ncbi:MAG: mandelate racemase/muconate lactonizing enzyme family protein [Acetobacterales bacterium]
MRIVEHRVDSIPVNHRGNWVLVGLFTDDGLWGWGEASDSRDETLCIATLERELAELRQGDDDALEIAARLVAHLPEDKPRRTALSALNQALWDIAARREGRPVAALLTPGTPRPTMPLYANVNRMCRDRSPGTVAEAGRDVLARNIRRIKFAPFDEVTPQKLAKHGTGIVAAGRERLRALRDAVGDDTELMLDCHWRFTEDTVPLLAEIAREFAIGWIEDPLPRFEAGQMRRLRDLSGARIAGGEAFMTSEDLLRLAGSGCVDVLIADVKFVGGTGPLHEICRRCADLGIAFAPHNPSGPVSTAASAHVVAANPNAEILEFSFGEVPWRADVGAGEAVTDDSLTIAGPGYGLDIRRDRAGPPAAPPDPEAYPDHSARSRAASGTG